MSFGNSKEELAQEAERGITHMLVEVRTTHVAEARMEVGRIDPRFEAKTGHFETEPPQNDHI